MLDYTISCRMVHISYKSYHINCIYYVYALMLCRYIIIASMTPATHVTVMMSALTVGHVTSRLDSATAAVVSLAGNVMHVPAGLLKSLHKAVRSSMMHVHDHFPVASGGSVHHLVLWHTKTVRDVPVV